MLYYVKDLYYFTDMLESMYTYNFPLTFVVVVAFFYVVVFLSFDFVWYKCRLVLCKKIDFEEETISLNKSNQNQNRIRKLLMDNVIGLWAWS